MISCRMRNVRALKDHYYMFSIEVDTDRRKKVIVIFPSSMRLKYSICLLDLISQTPSPFAVEREYDSIGFELNRHSLSIRSNLIRFEPVTCHL